MSSSESASPKSNLKFPIDLPVVLTKSKIQELQEQNMTELTDGVLPDRVEVNDYIRFFCNNYRDQKLVINAPFCQSKKIGLPATLHITAEIYITLITEMIIDRGV